MTKATYTKIINSETFNDASMSLGFRRFFCLPREVKLNIGIAYYLLTGKTNNHKFTVDFFGKMTEEEYENYVLNYLATNEDILDSLETYDDVVAAA